MSLPDYPDHVPRGERWRDIKAPGIYADFDALLNSAAEEGILSERPTSEEESRASNYPVLASAIGERLSLLGYTDEEAHVARDLYVRDREAFFQAVEAFQSEAGLKPDRWVGKKTWTALGYLVNFGSDNDDFTEVLPDDLVTCSLELGAVRRAAKLRLGILGLSSGKPSNRSPRASPAAIEKFHTIAQTLGILDADHPADELSQKSTRLLLSHDALIKALAEVPDGAIAKSPPKYRMIRGQRRKVHKDTNKDVKRFIVNLVRIELWLLGFDIDITSDKLYPIAQVRGAKRKRHPENTEIGGYLLEFYAEFGAVLQDTPFDRSPHRAEMIDNNLFRAFAEIDDKGAAVDEEVATREAQAKVDRELFDDKRVLKALEEGRSFGLQIWDGIKRVWRWIKRGVERLIDIGKNLIRAFFRYASKGFRIARVALRALTSSLTSYLSGRLQFPSKPDAVPAVCVQLYKDFDMRIDIDVGTDRAVLDESSDHMVLFSQRFQLSCEILSIVIGAVRAVAASFVGWALLAKALIRHLREITALYRSIMTIEDHLAA